MKHELEERAVISLADKRCKRIDLQAGTMQEAWSIYQASLALEALRPSSRMCYAQAARLAIEQLSPRPKPGEVRLWLERMREDKAPATVNKLLRALKAITERASYVQKGGNLALRNVFKSQRPFRLEARARRDASHETVERLLELASTVFERLAIRLAAFYGLRLGELLGLEPSDARSDNGIIRITVIRTRDGFGVRSRKNALNGKPHVLRIDDGETAGILSAVLCKETRLRLAEPNQRELAERYILPWGPGHTKNLIAKWRRDERVQLPRGDGFHALRHYGATQLAASGATLIEIQAWLGDSTPNAAQTYLGQVRGTTMGTARKIITSFEQNRGSLS